MKTVLLVLLLLSICFAEQSAMAVLNFQSDDLTTVQKAALAGSLSTAMRSNSVWRVITWEEVARMLENTRNRMLLDCDDSQCIDAIAGALNVQFLTSGEVSRFGSLWMVNVRLIDTWAAHTVHSVSRTVESLEDIVRAMPEIAAEIIGREEPVELLFPLHISSNDGFVEKSPLKDRYAIGDRVVLKAVPNSGFNFGGWEGDLQGISTSATLQISGEHFVRARFNPVAEASVKERRRRGPFIALGLLGLGGGAYLIHSLTSSSTSEQMGSIEIIAPPAR